MSEFPIRPHYGRTMAVFLQFWNVTGLLSFLATGVFWCSYLFEPNGVMLVFAILALVVLSSYVCSVPAIIACKSVHPSRTGIYFLTWLGGWTTLGWIIAMCWAFNGYNDRKQRLIRDSELELPSSIPIAYMCLGLLIIGLVEYATLKNLPSHNPPAEVVNVKAPDATQPRISESPTPPDTVSAQKTILDSYSQAMTEFREKLPTLAEPAPNLRWFPQKDQGSDQYSAVSTILVTPFGPCALLRGQKQSLLAMTMHGTPDNPNVVNKVLGIYPSEEDAEQEAVKYCSAWYQTAVTRPFDPATELYHWFPADEVLTDEGSSQITSGQQ